MAALCPFIVCTAGASGNACDFGFLAVRGECLPYTDIALERVGPMMEPQSPIAPAMTTTATTLSTTTLPHHVQVRNHIIKHINSSIHKDVHRHLHDGPQHDFAGLDDEQVHTVVYIGLALMFVFTIGTISALYMRSLKEHRKNQGWIKLYREFEFGFSNRECRDNDSKDS